MLKRTFSSVFYLTINNSRWFSLTAISNREQKRDIDQTSVEIKNEHRQFARFHSKNQTEEQKELDIQKPRFNRYNVTKFNSKKTSKKKSIDDDDNDIFTEEKDDLTMLGADRKAFSLSSAKSTQKPSTTAVSLNKKTET